MWTVTLCVVLIIFVTQWIIKWRNPNPKNGIVLPPGSMGFPFIGETLSLISPSYSLDLHPFVKNRVQRYGPIFRTSVAGQAVLVSTDPEFNNYIISQEGRLVEIHYMDTFTEMVNQGAETQVTSTGLVHKYVRGSFLNHFGAEMLKTKLLPRIEEYVDRTLRAWSTQSSVDVKHATSVMALNFWANEAFGYNEAKSSFNLSQKYTRIIDGLLAFPLNIPGTAHRRCLKDKEMVTTMLKGVLKERKNSPEIRNNGGDFLDQLIRDMDKERFLSEDFIANFVFVLQLATLESISLVLALALKLLSEHPLALQELTAEHDAILKRRQNPNSLITWDEYKSMTFSHQVINETLRLTNSPPGLLRRAIKDIPVKGTGFTIPQGWTIMVVNSGLHMNPQTFKNPLEFNPWRWKDLEQHVVSKNFMPFGGGTRQCAGAEYSRVFMCTFFHVLLTKYTWTKTEGGQIIRNPILVFEKCIRIKLSQR